MRRAITLVELLVSLVILAILLGLSVLLVKMAFQQSERLIDGPPMENYKRVMKRAR